MIRAKKLVPYKHGDKVKLTYEAYQKYTHPLNNWCKLDKVLTVDEMQGIYLFIKEMNGGCLFNSEVTPVNITKDIISILNKKL
jgi:hypothetical protein